ncbi:hypothetical protein [Sphingobium sp. MI1205]|uniref:hypothetical protein n=1 Tax=Sphingobium sp. MI1205 TaxID=407020 RepID=UPI0007702CE4|nr:hypothetical protein [Sphingobium sp. MI1205]AMK18934.1 hypothetical protein K663_12770 [Sphingobium sp. MI1205]
MSRPFVAFHFGLVQDVAVLRPLVLLARSLPSLDLEILITDNFHRLDEDGLWFGELKRLGAEVGVQPFTYQSPFDCLRHFRQRRGMIIAGSESNVVAHQHAHNLFRSVPGNIRTVTLQHGFECLGFLHNARHDAAIGRDIRFSADIIVGWFAERHLHALPLNERNKLFIAGPPVMIDAPTAVDEVDYHELPGLICENLHSIRFGNSRLRESFIDTFLAFAERVGSVDQQLLLRAHPAGRFTERNRLTLPANVNVSRAPLYDIDLSTFAYAVSAPSTILFDFVVAKVPVSVWVDLDGDVDTSNFPGLPTVATVEDLWHFNWMARWHRQFLLDRQENFLTELGIPQDVKARYIQLFSLAL